MMPALWTTTSAPSNRSARCSARRCGAVGAVTSQVQGGTLHAVRDGGQLLPRRGDVGADDVVARTGQHLRRGGPDALRRTGDDGDPAFPGGGRGPLADDERLPVDERRTGRAEELHGAAQRRGGPVRDAQQVHRRPAAGLLGEAADETLQTPLDGPALGVLDVGGDRGQDEDPAPGAPEPRGEGQQFVELGDGAQPGGVDDERRQGPVTAAHRDPAVPQPLRDLVHPRGPAEADDEGRVHGPLLVGDEPAQPGRSRQPGPRRQQLPGAVRTNAP